MQLYFLGKDKTTNQWVRFDARDQCGKYNYMVRGSKALSLVPTLARCLPPAEPDFAGLARCLDKNCRGALYGISQLGFKSPTDLA
jgi:hypothetical protein